MYKLLITCSERNENYEAEKEKFNRESRYNMNAEYPKNYIEVKSLEVELTTDELEAIKKAVLEAM